MLKIGITGGIGSGKSTICLIFTQLGIPVYSADNRAKELMRTDKELAEGIKNTFGPEVYDIHGNLNKALLASRVFRDPDQLQMLNALVHPVVFKDYHLWKKRHKVPYIIKEAALMFESGSYKSQDYIITVSAPEELRIQRVMERDDTDRKTIEERIKNQLREDERLKRADFIIKNDGSEPLIRQVLKLHKRFTKEAGNQ